MSRRPYLSLAVLSFVAASATACSSDVRVAPWEPTPESVEGCEIIHADAPDDVSGQEGRTVAGDQALAWGDPAIILRCGIAEPTDLGPTSRCDMVDSIGWFTEERPGSTLFTTIGREYFVSIEVPDTYQPAADALIDLHDVIAENNAEVTPCV